MDINRPNAQPPTQEELNDLAKLRATLERAIADGVLTRGEVEFYKAQAWADGKITPQELSVYQEPVVAKITTGELRWERRGWAAPTRAAPASAAPSP
ncbi:MAG: hypothetical protein R6U00_08645 [Prochlorococcaceae cyanobacterium]